MSEAIVHFVREILKMSRGKITGLRLVLAEAKSGFGNKSFWEVGLLI